MSLEQIVAAGHEASASDIHLEGGLPIALRIAGKLTFSGEPIAPQFLTNLVREVVGPDDLDLFQQQRSYDAARTFAGVRCRINLPQNVGCFECAQ